MRKNLALTLKKSTVDKAKEYAASRNTSLSKLVENYLQKITEGEQDGLQITPLVKSLSGILNLPKDYDHKKNGYADYLLMKY
jgi:hypothetical protein